MTGFNPANFTVAKAKPLPVVLLLDVSTSMGGENINKLNAAVKEMISDFAAAEKNEVEILVSIITFGAEVLLHTPYTSAKDIEWQDLQVSGATPMGTAFSMAKAMIEDKEVTPSRAYRPTIILVSDGEPNDSWQQPLRDLVNEGRSQKCDRMAMAIGSEASNNVLNEFISGTENKVFTAQDSDYREAVLPSSIRARVAVEAAHVDYWYKFVGLDGKVIGMTTYGESAPAEVLFKEFGITDEAVVDAVKSLVS